MKKYSLLTMLAILILNLTACTAQVTQPNPTGQAGAGNETQPGLSTLNTLAVGIFKMDGTANDITAEQAKELVVLWKAYNQVKNSDTASPEEKDALVSQIASTLTEEQNAAIQNLALTAQDVTKLMQEKGISSKAEVKTSNSASSSSGRGMGGPGGFPGGGMPGGGPMDSGGMPGGGMSVTPAAGQSGGRPEMGGFVTENMTQAIIEALIQVLETKIV